MINWRRPTSLANAEMEALKRLRQDTASSREAERLFLACINVIENKHPAKPTIQY